MYIINKRILMCCIFCCIFVIIFTGKIRAINEESLTPKLLIECLNNKKVTTDRKIATIKLFSENLGLKLTVDMANQLCNMYLKSQNKKLCKSLYNLIVLQLSTQNKIIATQKRIKEEKIFKKRDALIERLLFCLKKDKQTDVYLYTTLKEILKKLSNEYSNHYYSKNSDRIFARALLAKKVPDLLLNIHEKIQQIEDINQINPYLPFLNKHAVLLPTRTIALLEIKLKTANSNKIAIKINKILFKNSLQIKYPKLQKMSIENLNELLSKRSNSLDMRIEAIRVLTMKFKRRLFSQSKNSTSTSKLLLSLLYDKNESKTLKLAILSRIARESDVLKNKLELHRNTQLIIETLLSLSNQDDISLQKSFIFLIPSKILKHKQISQTLCNILKNDKTSIDTKCSILFLFSQTKINASIDIFANVLTILKAKSKTLSDDNKRALSFSLQLAYKNKLKSKIATLSKEDKKILKILKLSR